VKKTVDFQADWFERNVKKRDFKIYKIKTLMESFQLFHKN